jgi:hypothetical protein
MAVAVAMIMMMSSKKNSCHYHAYHHHRSIAREHMGASPAIFIPIAAAVRPAGSITAKIYTPRVISCYLRGKCKRHRHGENNEEYVLFHKSLLNCQPKG